MAEKQYTSAQICAGISAALKAKDMKAAVGLMQLLATVDPRTAATLLGAIEFLRSPEESREEHE